MSTHHISGAPIVDQTGRLASPLTIRDVRFAEVSGSQCGFTREGLPGRGQPGRDARSGTGSVCQGQAELTKLVPEGVEARVPYKGEWTDSVFQLVGGLYSGVGYVGAGSS